MTDAVIAVDPGREKCGVAAVHRLNGVLYKAVVETGRLSGVVLDLARRFAISAVVVGDRTSHRETVRALGALRPDGCPLDIGTVDEHRSTDEARSRYWLDHPPRGLLRLIPVTMRFPPEPVDDYVAVILAERYFGRRTD